MTSVEFGKKCRELNRKYREIFNEVPCWDDYVCTQEEFINALNKSILTKSEISSYISKRPERDYSSSNIKY